MAKRLSGEEFSRAVVTRVQRERPDLNAEAVGYFFLLVEPEPGNRRMLSLADLYQECCEYPTERDEVIGAFLSNLVYREPAGVKGTFTENRPQIFPQVVPPNLLEHCMDQGRDLAAIPFIGDLFLAFVLDEPERYSYLERHITQRWEVGEVPLLAASVQNLQARFRENPGFVQSGKGTRTRLVWETADGYDATRILLTRELTHLAANLPGNPVIAIPHRDCMLMFGDTDAAFVDMMAEQVRGEYESKPYPVSPRLYTIMGGVLQAYDRNCSRVLN